jgi:hypothetical protein
LHGQPETCSSRAPVVPRLALLVFGPFWRRTGEVPDLQRYHDATEALIAEYCERRKL